MNSVSPPEDGLGIQVIEQGDQVNIDEERQGNISILPYQPSANADKGNASEQSAFDKDLANRFCSKPFEFFELTPNGDVQCCCWKWLPKIIGNLHENDMMEVWNSETVREIRASILDGSFKYCQKEVCPEIQNGRLPYKEEISEPDLKEIIENKTTVLKKKPKTLNLAYDRTCNLSCPSCRTEKIVIKGKEYDKTLQLQERLLAGGLEDAQIVIVTGSGDPFASKLYRDLLTDLDAEKYPQLTVHLMTNGQLFTPSAWAKWKKSHKVIKAVQISMDAASEETYRIVRRGGTFQVLLDNLEFVASLRRKGELEWVRTDFVVQQANYKEMKRYVEYSKSFGFDLAGLSMINDWGTFGSEEFSFQAIQDPAHPEHSQFLDVLQDPIFDDPIVYLGNLTPFRALAIKQEQV